MSQMGVTGYREPVQKRSRATLDRILDTVVELLQHQRLREISVVTICEAAGVSRSSFYARFPTRDALAVALADRYAAAIDRAAERVEEELLTLGDGREGSAIGVLLQRYFDFVRDTTPLRLTVEELPTTHRRIGPTEESVVDRLLDVADRLLGPLDGPNRQRIRFASVVCAGALGHWVGGYLWQLDRTWWTDERFVGELAHMVSAYLVSAGLIDTGDRSQEDRTTATSPTPADAVDTPTTPVPDELEPTRSYEFPRQRRSRETFERILTTVGRLLEHHALDELSIDRICAEADVSQSSFFARFPTREALVEALADRYVAWGASAVRAAEHELASLGTLAPDAVVELMIRTYFDFERRSTALRLVALENAVARRRFRAVEEATMARLVNVAEVIFGPLNHEDQQRIRFLSVFCTGAIDQWIGGHVQPLARGWWDDEQFITELVGMVTAYLGSWVRRA